MFFSFFFFKNTPPPQAMAESLGMLVVQEVVVVVLCILCILVTLVPTTILTSHFNSLPIIKRNLLTRQDQLLVSCLTLFIFSQVTSQFPRQTISHSRSLTI